MKLKGTYLGKPTPSDFNVFSFIFFKKLKLLVFFSLIS